MVEAHIRQGRERPGCNKDAEDVCSCWLNVVKVHMKASLIHILMAQWADLLFCNLEEEKGHAS